LRCLSGTQFQDFASFCTISPEFSIGFCIVGGVSVKLTSEHRRYPGERTTKACQSAWFGGGPLLHLSYTGKTWTPRNGRCFSRPSGMFLSPPTRPGPPSPLLPSPSTTPAAPIRSPTEPEPRDTTRRRPIPSRRLRHSRPRRTSAAADLEPGRKEPRHRQAATHPHPPPGTPEPTQDAARHRPPANPPGRNSEPTPPTRAYPGLLPSPEIRHVCMSLTGFLIFSILPSRI
jgi:hypothetical protein